MANLIRCQILLEDWQKEALEKLGATYDLSLSEACRLMTTIGLKLSQNFPAALREKKHRETLLHQTRSHLEMRGEL